MKEKINPEIDQLSYFVPCFIADLSKINPKDAERISRDFLPPNPYFSNELSSQVTRFHQLRGLEICRQYNTEPSQLPDILGQKDAKDVTILDLFDMFNSIDRTGLEQVMKEEHIKREERDRDILKMEMYFLKRRNIIHPNFSTLLEYCGWIPENSGYNAGQRERGNFNFTVSSQQVYWDLLEHYFQIIIKARTSFDPQTDWLQYLEGNLDLTEYDSWGLQNVGTIDLSYYSVNERWGLGVRNHSLPNSYNDHLITHSTSLSSAQMIAAQGFLCPTNIPRICFSSGRIVQTGLRSDGVVFIFPKDIITRTYALQMYTEPGCNHENELRAHEPCDIRLAIGCVPLSTALFPDQTGGGQGSRSMGAITLKRWGDHYIQTGNLWSPQEEAQIRNIADYLSDKNKKIW